jgi:hypothetical protein
MKFTSTLSRNNQAKRNTPAMKRAVSEASCGSFDASPAAISAIDTPRSSEMAEVGPIASCRDVPKST